MIDAGIQARLEREATFHDHSFTSDLRQDTGKYYAVTDRSRRRYAALTLEQASQRDVLEYGCGTGSLAFDLGRAGARVTGIDISPVAIDIATAQAAQLNLTEQIRFMVMNAEALDFPDNSFDRVCGLSILHHLDLERSCAEVARVLRPNGDAVFYEPLGHNPFINWYRNRTPQMRTPDEHPLLRADLQMIRRHFPRTRMEYYHLASLATVPLLRTPLFRPLCAAAEMLDTVAMTVIPPLRLWAWVIVMRLRK